MIKSSKSKKSKNSKIKNKRGKNPAETRGSYNEAAGFQDVRSSLSSILGFDDSNLDYEPPLDHLYYTLSHFISNPQSYQKRNSLNSYTLEILTPEVKKTMKEFVKSLRKSVIEVAKEYDIDSYTGEFIK